MLNLKKTAIAVLALGSSAVFAGSMGPVCSAVNVTVPCESTAWAVGAKALYLKPSVSTGIYDPLLSSGINNQPNYSWGFEVEGAYHFNTGNDININWYHLSRSKTSNYGVGTLNSFTGLDGITTTSTRQVGSFSTNPKWDDVNFEFGQHVDFGDNKAIRFHGGAQYVRLVNDIDASYTSSVTRAGVATSYNQTTDFDRTYNGFGPRVGADMSYDFGNGLGIYANGATGLLAGTRSFNNSYIDNRGNSIYTRASRTAVVPTMDAKLGLMYSYAMAQGDLTLDAGWMWVNYFNAHNDAASSTTSDFALQGLYFGLKWMGNVA